MKGVLWTLAWNFGLISLMTIGGGFSALPEMHRVAVDVYGWMSSETFANLFALAQAAPGPNLIVVALLGWQVAGIAGAMVAAGAICIPAFAIVFTASKLTTRWNHLPWYKVFERGLLPITLGLIVASAGLLSIAAAGPRWGSFAVTALTAAGVLWTRLNPLALLGIAAVLGMLNLV